MPGTPRELPVLFFKNFVLSAIKKFNILFISAETGSGKTIFVPQILYKSGLFNKILVSQTRRIAAISSAKYVSKIFNKKLGVEIGYSVRFDELFNHKTKIKFVTDGILFREISSFSFFLSYCCVIVDEFHERTVYTDLILAILRNAILLGKKISIVIMSASGNSKKIANFFGMGVCKLSIPGNLYKVSVYFSLFSQNNFLFSTILSVLKIHFSQKIPGDILVFLPGFDEIEEVFHHLCFAFHKNKDRVFLKKFHSNLSVEEQSSIFNETPTNFRKIILSTNIAESSLTIPGIIYVVDSGLSKQKLLNWKTGIDVFRIFPISKSEARQRKGRAGRQTNGKCFRLFTFLDFKKLPRFPNPQIKKTEMAGIILILSTFNQKNLFNLDFISLPSRWIIIRSLELLFILGAIDKKLSLTFFGKCMSFFPIDLKVTKSIIESLKFNEKKIVSWIVSASSIYSINFFINPKIFNYKGVKNSKSQGDLFFFAKILLKYQAKKKKKEKKLGVKKIISMSV